MKNYRGLAGLILGCCAFGLGDLPGHFGGFPSLPPSLSFSFTCEWPPLAIDKTTDRARRRELADSTRPARTRRGGERRGVYRKRRRTR